MEQRYDLCIIGGGPAGYTAAVRALDFNKKVVVVEKNRLGGAGLHDGALSSKTLWELAKDVRNLQSGGRGYKVSAFDIDYQEVIQTMYAAVAQREGQLQHQFSKFERQIFPDDFRYIQGVARLLSSTKVLINKLGGESETIEADNILLATGSRPRYLPNIPIDEKIIVTSDGVGSFEHFPESLVILGAGVVGCEFAAIFSNFGKTKVFLIDKADTILPFEDTDITQLAASHLEQSGVVIHHNSSLHSMSIEDGRVKYVLNYVDGRQETHYAEKALVSIGRVSNIEDLGLAEVGVHVNERGAFKCDDTRTEVPNIYAAGDLTADICLANVAEMEGRHAVEKMFGGKMERLKYDNVSTIMFLHPEIAGVGMNEIQAQRANIPYRVATYSYEYISRAICMRNTNGLFKIIVTDDDEMRILGMRAIGVQASSSIEGVALLIALEKGIEELAELPHPHPAITEGVQECARMLLGRSIIKPNLFSNLRCSRNINGVYSDFC